MTGTGKTMCMQRAACAAHGQARVEGDEATTRITLPCPVAICYLPTGSEGSRQQRHTRGMGEMGALIHGFVPTLDNLQPSPWVASDDN